jgi:DNA-binding NtrC family response regulator
MDQPETPKILLIEDDPIALRLLEVQLSAAGFVSTTAQSGAEALERVDETTSAICLDLGLGDMPGLDVLAHLQERYPDVPVIVVTASDRAEDAVLSLRTGAYDYLVKPVEELRLQSTLRRAVDRRRLLLALRERRDDSGSAASRMVGQSAPMRALGSKIERVLSSDVSVAIFGESGTGKELVARTLHEKGQRRAGPFVALNCAAIPENLLESELFGHEKGAFTGAQALHKGRFEQAHGGTLFLDEIGEMSPATQASLLRTLQEGTIRRVGGTKEIRVDARVVCATHRDLMAEVEAGRFRADLYYRLVVFPIELPPLRERPDDIPLLVAHFLKSIAEDSEVTNVDSEALEALSAYSWPGNVRELQNVIQRAVLSCDGRTIKANHLPSNIARKTIPALPAPQQSKPLGPALPLLPLAELERTAIRNAMVHTKGSVSKAAKILGIGRATLYRRLAADSSLAEALHA